MSAHVDGGAEGLVYLAPVVNNGVLKFCMGSKNKIGYYPSPPALCVFLAEKGGILKCWPRTLKLFEGVGLGEMFEDDFAKMVWLKWVMRYLKSKYPCCHSGFKHVGFCMQKNNIWHTVSTQKTINHLEPSGSIREMGKNMTVWFAPNQTVVFWLISQAGVVGLNYRFLC
jgi:hypothetical protein